MEICPVDLPFNRMQLRIFPSQRDNEVSSSEENEAVVCLWGHGASRSKLNQVFFFLREVGERICKDASELIIDRTPGGCWVTLITSAKR